MSSQLIFCVFHFSFFNSWNSISSNWRRWCVLSPLINYHKFFIKLPSLVAFPPIVPLLNGRLYQYSGTPPYRHLVITATFFLAVQPNDHTFSSKTTLLIRSPVNTANFYWPIGDRIKGVPLDYSVTT